MKFLLDGVETDRIHFRRIQLSDFEAWLLFFEDPNNFKHWITNHEAPQTACEKWYEKQFHRYENNLGGMNALLDKQSGKLIGHCGLLVQTVDDITELEVGYSLLPEFWNRGLASEAAKKCRDFAFENSLAESLISIISVTNLPSVKVALNNGMTQEKVTLYHENRVNIFRINKTEWKRSHQAIALY
jgi:RimJ/RimL family protein N-acetyltransferase